MIIKQQRPRLAAKYPSHGPENLSYDYSDGKDYTGYYDTVRTDFQ